METVASKTMVVVKRKEDALDAILKTLKGDVLKEFEKVCPTDMSFQRIKKDMHNLFDEAERQLSK
jgi:hypothetical protein